MKKTTSAIAVLGAFALTLSGCSLYGGDTSPSGDGVTVTWLIPSSQTQIANFDGAVQAWEDETGNTVDVQAVPDDNYASLVSTRLQAGTGVDIFSGTFDKFDVANQLAAIDPSSFESRIDPVLMNAMNFEGATYSIPGPTGINSFGVFYNVDAFATAGITTPPTTLQELTDAMAALQSAGINPITFSGGGGDAWTLLQHRNAVYFSLGGVAPETWQRLNDNATQWQDVPVFTEQVDALSAWAGAGYVNADAATATYADAQAAVANGTSAMLIQGDWVLSGIAETNPDANIGFFPLPTSSGDNFIGLSAGDGGRHIAASSTVKDAAQALLEFMISPEQIALAVEATPAISAFNDVDVTQYQSPALRSIQTLIDDGKATDKGEASYRIPSPDSDLQALYQDLLAQRIDAAAFVAGWQQAYVNSAKTAGISGF